MAIIRQKRKERFSIVDNKVIEDKRLSFKARGLLIYMLSKPDDWKFYTDELVKRSVKDGISAIKSTLREIEAAGYLVRKQGHKSNGQFTSQDWILTDISTDLPQVENPPADKPSAAKPLAGNQSLPNTDFKPNTDLTNTDKSLVDAQHSIQDVFTLWQNNWGFPNGIAQQDLTEWVNEFGGDLVYYVIEAALRRNVRSSGADSYLRITLSTYKDRGIDTVEKAVQEAEQHQQQMSREYQQKGNYYPRRSPNHEVIPEWAKKDHKKNPEPQPDPHIQHGYVMPDDSMESIPK